MNTIGVFNNRFRRIGEINFCISSSELKEVFVEYLSGTVYESSFSLKMSLSLLKQLKSVVESKSFLKKDIEVTIY